MAFDPIRFLYAQAHSYERALTEIRNGKKESHWMWFIFPQITGLGNSPKAQLYGLDDLAAAKAYLTHPVLGSRLIAVCEMLLMHVGKNITDIFPYPDDLKLKSSLTLFAQVPDCPAIFHQLIDVLYNGSKCEFTLHKIA